MNVAFAKEDGNLLPGGARRLNIITDKRIILSYEKCKELLRIDHGAVVTNRAEPISVLPASQEASGVKTS